MFLFFIFFLFFFQNIIPVALPKFGKDNTYYHIHFHVHEKELSQLLSKRLQALVARGEVLIHFMEDKDNLKRLGLQLLAMGIVGVCSYNILQSYLKHKKVYEELKIIMFDNEEIDTFLKNKEIPESEKSTSFFVFYFQELGITKYWLKKNTKTKKQELLLKEVFDIIKKDYRFSQILFLLQKESLTKSILYKMIYHIIYSEYICV